MIRQGANGGTMKLVVKNWWAFALLIVYTLGFWYIVAGLMRMFDSEILGNPEAYQDQWLDAWWQLVCEGLREQTTLTLLLLSAVVYLMAGVVRMTLCLGMKYVDSDEDTVQYRPFWDAWWCELCYMLSCLRAIFRRPIHH